MQIIVFVNVIIIRFKSFRGYSIHGFLCLVYAYLRDTDWFDGPAAIWITFGSQFVGHENAFHHNLLVQDWCVGPCNGNFSIGQVCNVSAQVAPKTSSGPPLNTFITLTLNASHSLAMRHCDFVVYGTPLGVGLKNDYIFKIIASLNGETSAVSFTAIDFPDHYLAVSTDGTVSMMTKPDAHSASWLFTSVDETAFTLSSRSKSPSFNGLLLTLQPTLTGPCSGEAEFHGDIALNASSMSLASKQLWSFVTPPVPPPPPGIAVTDVHDNSYYLPAGTSTTEVYECDLPLSDYQRSCEYCDPRSTSNIGWPEDDVILSAARKALNL